MDKNRQTSIDLRSLGLLCQQRCQHCLGNRDMCLHRQFTTDTTYIHQPLHIRVSQLSYILTVSPVEQLTQIANIQCEFAQSEYYVHSDLSGKVFKVTSSQALILLCDLGQCIMRWQKQDMKRHVGCPLCFFLKITFFHINTWKTCKYT